MTTSAYFKVKDTTNAREEVYHFFDGSSEEAAVEAFAQAKVTQTQLAILRGSPRISFFGKVSFVPFWKGVPTVGEEA